MANELTAFLHDSNSRRVVGTASEQADVRRGNVRTAARACVREPSADILLVDLDGEQNPMTHVAALLEVCRPESTILATGSENNVALANELYRGGVFLYLPKPLGANDVRRGISEVGLTQADDARPAIQTTRLVLVLGKGFGTNTVTAVLARMLAERGRYVACLDLDPSFGTLALAFNVEPERGFAQALASPGEGLDIERLQTRVSPRITLVAHPFDQAGEAADGDAGLPELLNAMSGHAHVILVVGATPVHVDSLRHLTTNHVVVFEPTPAGLSVAVRWLRVLQGLASTLVMNRPRPVSETLRPEQIRSSLGGRGPDIELPYMSAMARAMALGEPERAITRRERTELGKLMNALAGLGGAAQEDG